MEKYRKSILKNEIAFIIGRLISFISVIWLIDLYHRDELFIEFLKYETLPIIFSSLLFWRKINLNNLIVKVTMAAITLYNLFEFNFYSLLAQYILSETIVQALMYNNARSKNIRIGLMALTMNMCFIISAQVLNLQFTYFLILFVLTSTSMAFLFMFIVKENDYSNSGRALRSIFRQIYVFGFRSAFLNATMPVIYIYLLKFVNLLIVYAMSFSRSKDSSILSLHISNLQIYSTLSDGPHDPYELAYVTYAVEQLEILYHQTVRERALYQRYLSEARAQRRKALRAWCVFNHDETLSSRNELNLHQ